MNAKIRIFDSFGGLSSFPAALSGGKKRGKKYPIDWYNNFSSMNTGTANARSKELVNRATVRRKHPVHSCRNRTRAKGRKSKETGRREGGRRRGRGRASAPPRSHTRVYIHIYVYIYAYVGFLLAYTHARVRARNLNEGACDERARMHVKASVHAHERIAGCENRRAKIDQSGAEAGVGGAATWCRGGQSKARRSRISSRFPA